MPKNHPASVRPRIQRAFIAWLAENKGRFLIPISIGKRTGLSLNIRLHGINPAIHISLSRQELVAAVEWKSECIDFLFSFEAMPEKSAKGGYHCKLCIDKPLREYPSRKDLWVDHLFEPFLVWVNEKLQPSLWLCLHKWPSRSSYAELLQQEPTIKPTQIDDAYTIYIPVKPHT